MAAYNKNDGVITYDKGREIYKAAEPK